MQRPKSARGGPDDDAQGDLNPDAPTFASKAILSDGLVVLPSGQTLSGRYEIVRVLGHGGMGAVYEARDLELDRTVAIKVIRPDLATDPETVRRFKQELLLSRQVSHRNVVRIFDLGESDGMKFISMEYVQGTELSKLIASGAVPPARATHIVHQIAQALEAAHAEHVVHRDLKPHNVVVDANDRAYVMDFGIARSLLEGGMTQTGAIVGTLEYMSPEQARGVAVDERTDIYALGLIFYELLTGTSAFKGDTALASLYRRTHERAISPTQIDAKVPAKLSAIVLKCLEPDASKRYQSATEVIQALDAWLGVAPRTQFRHSRIIIPQQNSHLPLIFSGVALAVILGIGGWFVLHPKVPNTAPQKAVSVLVADFTNHTGDPVFDNTLEPMVNVALEGASFVNAFNRGEARKAAKQLQNGSDKLDEQAARLVAVSHSIGAIITGSISRRGGQYRISIEALDGVTGDSIALSEITASQKDDVLLAIPKLTAPVRKALGDKTPESVQLAATAGSFSVKSLEAVHQYGVAMEQQFAGNMEGALQSFSKAAELDPDFGRAYSGMATSSRNLGRLDDAQKYLELAMQHVDRMTERERYRARGAYYVVTGNLQKCVDEYTALVSQFPSDNIAHSNLGTCYSRLRNMPKAVEEAKRAVEIQPRSAGQRMNLSLYASYAGDFVTGEREAREVQSINPTYEKGYLALADAQMGQGQVQAASETYQILQKLSKNGESLAASGLADIAIYGGRFADGIRGLQEGAAMDLAEKRAERAADKYVAIAYAHLSAGRVQDSVVASKKALANSKSVKTRFLAGHVLARAGDTAAAAELARGLTAELLPEPQVYGKIIDAEIALHRKDTGRAIQLLTEAKTALDTWIGRFGLARAYLEAGLLAEADSEFDTCLKRRGEALELMDDGPTYGMFPAVYYFQGVVRQGLKSPGYPASYQAYLDIRGRSTEDPLVSNARRQLSGNTHAAAAGR